MVGNPVTIPSLCQFFVIAFIIVRNKNGLDTLKGEKKETLIGGMWWEHRGKAEQLGLGKDWKWSSSCSLGAGEQDH